MKYTLSVRMVLLMCLLACGGCMTAQRGAIARAQYAMQDGNFEIALKHLARSEEYANPSPEMASRLYFLKGVCFENLQRPQEAQGMFKYVVENFPNTPYGSMAKEKLSINNNNQAAPKHQ